MLASRTTPEIVNLHVSTMQATDDPTRTVLRTTFVPFEVAPGDTYGGHISTIEYRNGSSAGAGVHGFRNTDAERAAAAALLDAVRGSGLLTMDLPAYDRKRPEAGHTRIYLDRRARFLEFETTAPPAVAQAVLGALAVYERIAAQG